jgi:hypothetical protein
MFELFKVHCTDGTYIGGLVPNYPL